MKPFAATLTLALSLAAAPAAAQQAVPCDWPARADALVEPWEDHTRTFAKGEVRLALLDTVEPAAGAYHILVLSPPYDEMGARQCRTLGLSDGMGFAGVDFSSLTAHYEATLGLVFQMTVQVFDGAEITPETLNVVLNQSTGALSAQLQ